MRRTGSLAVVSVCVVLLIASYASAQEKNESKEATKSVLDFGRQQASTYTVEIDETRELKLENTAVLSWTNPIRKSKNGTVFVWTDEGRPAAIVCIYMSSTSFRWQHEFQSLTPRPVRATQGDNIPWDTKEPGLEWIAYDGMKPPAKRASLRLGQMRAIASKFKADLQTGEHLRLLRQPIYRYETNKFDGAIFALAQGTNPELLVLVEVEDGEDAAKPWRYALARATGRGIIVKTPDRGELTIPRARSGSPKSAYFNRSMGEIPGSPR